MKIIGMLLLMASTTGAGIAISSIQKKKYDICGELIKLCDSLLIDLEYKVTPINILVKNCLENNDNLSFISVDNIVELLQVESLLNTAENEAISRFLYQLGKSDVNSQIKLIRAFKAEFLTAKDKYFEQYNRYKKIDISFGIFAGVLICIIVA